MGALAHLVTSTEFEHAWPLLEPAVERRGAHTKDSVWARLRHGKARLWTTDRTAMVGEIWNWPSGKRVSNTWLLGGDLDEIVSIMDPVMHAWSIEQGCSQNYMNARPGWQRVLPGYREIGRVIVRDLP